MNGIVPNGQCILEARLRLGLTQESLAQKASCDVKTIRRAEKWFAVSSSTLHRIAGALELSFADVATDRSTAKSDRRNFDLVWRYLDCVNRKDERFATSLFHREAFLIKVSRTTNPAKGFIVGREKLRRLWGSGAMWRNTELTRNNVQLISIREFVVMLLNSDASETAPEPRASDSFIIVLQFHEGLILGQVEIN